MKVTWEFEKALSELELFVAERPGIMKFFLDLNPSGRSDVEDILREYWHKSGCDDEFIDSLKQDGYFSAFRDEIVRWLEDDYDLLNEVLEKYFEESFAGIEQELHRVNRWDMFACQLKFENTPKTTIQTHIVADSFKDFLKLLDIHYSDILKTEFTLSFDGYTLSIELQGEDQKVFLDAWRLGDWLNDRVGQKGLTGLKLITSKLNYTDLEDLVQVGLDLLEKEGFAGVAAMLSDQIDQGADAFVLLSEYIEIRTLEAA